MKKLNLKSKTIFQLQKLARRGLLKIKLPAGNLVPKFPGQLEAVRDEVIQRGIFSRACQDVFKRVKGSVAHLEAVRQWEERGLQNRA